MSIFVSTGTHEVRVESRDSIATINTSNHSIRIDTHGQPVLQVQASSSGGISQVELRLAPPWLAWLRGERLTVEVRVKR